MTCTNPIEINGQLAFPCGKCMACRIQRTQEWAMRMVHEQMYHDCSLFVTLTYDDDHLPKGETLVADHLVGFVKRFRRSIEPRRLIYYSNGEYGDKDKRPHYHLIMYGIKSDDFEEHDVVVGKYQHSCWLKGFIDLEVLNYYTARYVAGYIRKKLNGEKAKQEYGDRMAPFKSCSQGLGIRWAIDNVELLKKNGFIMFMGKKLSIPRYYVKMLDLDCTEVSLKKQEQYEKEFVGRYSKQKNKEDDEFSFNVRSKVQKDKNIRAGQKEG